MLILAPWNFFWGQCGFAHARHSYYDVEFRILCHSPCWKASHVHTSFTGLPLSLLLS